MLNNLISLVGVFTASLLEKKDPQKPTQFLSIPDFRAKGKKYQTKIFHMLIYEGKIQRQSQISDCFKEGNDLLQNSSQLLLHWKPNKNLEVDQVAHLKCVNHSCHEKTDLKKKPDNLFVRGAVGHIFRSHRACTYQTEISDKFALEHTSANPCTLFWPPFALVFVIVLSTAVIEMKGLQVRIRLRRIHTLFS